MIYETPEGYIVRVCFPGAEAVYLLSESNHWSTTATPMQGGPRGIWQATLDRRPQFGHLGFFVHTPGQVGGQVYGGAQVAS